MKVRVLFFGILKDAAGKSVEELELRQGATIRDLLVHFGDVTPQLKQLFPSVACAVNRQYAGPETKLKAGDEVALLPPVSGGSGDGSSGTPAEKPLGRRRYASITRETISAQTIVESMKRGEDGATLAFEGIVRNQTRGRKTLYLDYEAYEEMALAQMEDLAEQALQQFKVRDVAIVHRLGRLNVGETSVLIAVASAHRGPGFEACRWLIDTLKRKVPIWKKEYFEDGVVWADGEPFPEDIPRANS